MPEYRMPKSGVILKANRKTINEEKEEHNIDNICALYLATHNIPNLNPADRSKRR